jgi:hypothetical protein
MPTACWRLVHSAVAHVAQVTTRAARHVAGPIGRHHFRRIAHAVHTAVTAHPRIWIETVCRVTPSVVVAAILTVPPIYTPAAGAADHLQPGVQSGDMVSPAMITPAATGVAFGFFPPSAATPPVALPSSYLSAGVPTPAGSTLVFFPQPAATPPTEVSPPSLIVDSSLPIITTPDIPPQAVPEPGSVSVLMMAICSLILISRRRRQETAAAK